MKHISCYQCGDPYATRHEIVSDKIVYMSCPMCSPKGGIALADDGGFEAYVDWTTRRKLAEKAEV